MLLVIIATGHILAEFASIACRDQHCLSLHTAHV
jgi:hypothetical protein